jgi:signal transduction histidine kinase
VATAEWGISGEERLRFLAEASHALSSSLDYRETLNEVARLVVPRLADWCMVDVVEDGRRVSVAVAHADPDKVRWARALLEEDGPRQDAPTGVPNVIRTGRSELYPEISDAMLVATAQNERELEALRALGMTSVMIVPLIARGSTLGTISFAWAETGGRYSEEDLAFAQDLARRAAVAVDNARLHDLAVRSADRLSRLQSVTARLAQALTPEDVVEVLLHEVIDAAGAAAGVVGLVNESGRRVNIIAVRGHEEDALESWESFDVDAAVPVSEAIRSGRAIYIRDRAERDARYPALAEVPNESRALVVLPLLGNDAPLGGVGLSFPEEREFAQDERELLETIAAQCGQALERARLYRETEVGRERIAGLQEVTAQLSGARTRHDVAHVIVTAGAGLLGAEGGWVAELSRDGERLEMLANVGYPEEQAAAFSVLPMALHNPTTDAVRDAMAGWYRCADEVVEAYPELAGRYTIYEAMTVVPLVTGDRATGVIALNFLRRRALVDRDRRLLETLAHQGAQALERARLYDEREERANAAFVLAHVADGVFQLDADRCIRFWNPAAARITGVSAEDALHRRIETLFEGWEPLEQDAEPVAVRIAGRDLWLSISGASYGDGTVYAFRDLTAEHQLEELRRDFLTTASHELRTPLAGVYGAAKTLLDRDLPPETRERLLEMVVSEGERLNRIVDDLLLANRLDVGALDVQLGRVEAATLAREAVELTEQRAPAGLEVRFGGGEAAALADAGRLRQVLMNLLDNAVKYSPDGGAIEVAVHANDGRVRFTVADQGLGIPEGEHELVFEKFYRLDPALSRGVGGTGLGLYISRELVRQMNGRIWVESRQGEGSTFHVELPAA